MTQKNGVKRKAQTPGLYHNNWTANIKSWHSHKFL